MRLTLHTDYALRALIYLATSGQEKPVPVSQMAQAYSISQHHLVKVVQSLRDHDLVRVRRGARGGVVLAVEPAKLKLGSVVRMFEPESVLDCVGSRSSDCTIHGSCRLRRALGRAQQAFFAELDALTLEDAVQPRSSLRRSLGIVGQPRTL